ncbi:methionine aminopeptidase [Tribonema minus]|uniref:Methionine aminopeptidase n=1 Tax=Tribonema minus TaxID=303371 RepID=A0A835YRW9_9STRA|nr:methionine aminopeptidase [Tribonema minus]
MMNKGFGFKAKPKQASFKYTGTTRPGVLSPTRKVPPEIMRPEYADTGRIITQPPRFPWVIEEKSEADIAGMRAAGRVAREVLDAAGRAVAAGVTTDSIDAVVHAETVARGAYPSPLNYSGFPKSCCTSLNEIVCHGIPDSTVLKEGDILNIDVTVFLNGYHGDCSEMFCVGEVDDAAKELLQVTYDAWQKAADFCKPGKHYKEIGAVIQEYVEARGYTTVKNFCGHGIGSVFHTNPTILHYKNNEPNGVMRVGHTFTIEPMICEGKPDNVVWPDKWTAATIDGKRTAQFEHTFLMNENGVEPLTGKLQTSPRQFWEK